MVLIVSPFPRHYDSYASERGRPKQTEAGRGRQRNRPQGIEMLLTPSFCLGNVAPDPVASRLFMAFSPLKWVKVGDQVQIAGLTECRVSLPAFPDEGACGFGPEICRGGDRIQQ